MTNQFEKSRPPKMRPTTGMTRALTSESTILPNAAPMITPTARSTTFPLSANSRNSLANDIGRRSFCLLSCRACAAGRLDSGLSALPGSDAHHLLDGRHEDLAIADLAGPRRLDDGLDRALHLRLGHDHLHFHLGQEIDDVFRAAIEFGVSLLPAEPLPLGDGQSRDADLGKRLAHFVELEWFDDRFDLFHGSVRCGPVVGRPREITPAPTPASGA